jgi:hypothetical protein
MYLHKKPSQGIKIPEFLALAGRQKTKRVGGHAGQR